MTATGGRTWASTRDHYGFGYFGEGFEGGRWDGGHFFYNRSVNNHKRQQHSQCLRYHVTYRNESHVSYNGGNVESARVQGLKTRRRRGRDTSHRSDSNATCAGSPSQPQQRASANMGKPGTAATPRPEI